LTPIIKPNKDPQPKLDNQKESKTQSLEKSSGFCISAACKEKCRILRFFCRSSALGVLPFFRKPIDCAHKKELDMNKNYTVRIYDHEKKVVDETAEKFTLREARTMVRKICSGLNKKYGILLDPSRFAVVIMKGKNFAFPESNKDLFGIHIVK
jgi:hypothetical protein